MTLRGRLVLLAVGVTAMLLLVGWVAVSGPLTAVAPETAHALRVALALLGAVALAVAIAGALLAARMVRRSLAQVSRAIEEGGAADVAFPDDLAAELGETYRRLARDLVRVDSSLAEEHSRFQAVLNGMDAGVFAIDGEQRLTLTNTALHEMVELGQQSLGRDYRELLPFPALHDAVNEALRGRVARVEVQIPGLQRRTIVANAAPQGTGAGVAVVVRDVTSVRHLERVRRDFVANISHELRTPVSVIQTAAETLLDGALEDPVHARAFVERIERHASRMSTIIAGLLDLARLEAGQQSLAKESVNVRAAIERAFDLVSAMARDKQVSLADGIAADTTVFADQKGVDQVLANLVVNAVKYAEPGGAVSVQAESHKGWVRVTVADDGPGIAPEHRERVFERFYRIDKGRSRETGGTGLGLAIVKHLTLAMGGTVGVEPRAPRGTTFWVRLPAGRAME